MAVAIARSSVQGSARRRENDASKATASAARVQRHLMVSMASTFRDRELAEELQVFMVSRGAGAERHQETEEASIECAAPPG
jgi:hypothetical protein